MTRKQKIMLLRILLTLCLTIPLSFVPAEGGEYLFQFDGITVIGKNGIQFGELYPAYRLNPPIDYADAEQTHVGGGPGKFTKDRRGRNARSNPQGHKLHDLQAQWAAAGTEEA